MQLTNYSANDTFCDQKKNPKAAEMKKEKKKKKIDSAIKKEKFLF